MFAFRYDAKWKQVLPYWDAFPLVMPFNISEDRFIGLNLHYLPPGERMKLLNFLIGFKSKKSTRDYVKISYEILKASTRENLYEPCIHSYLFSHVRSRFVKINHEEWKNAIHLPLAQWQKSKPY